jgi:hypothetical protein
VKDRCAESIDRAPDARQQGICACAHLRDPIRFLVERRGVPQSDGRQLPPAGGLTMSLALMVFARGTLPVAQASLA